MARVATPAVVAVRLALAVAARHGLHGLRPRAMADGANVVVHLFPAPVVAKVASHTLLVRPDAQAWLARELALAAHVAAAGLPVVAASDLLPPGPHVEEGVPMTFWRHLEHVPETPTPPVMGGLVAELHAVLRTCEVPLPHLGPPVVDVAGLLALRLLAPGDADRLRAAYDRLVPAALALGPVQALHGDPHPGNVLRAGGGWTWCDLEDACAGPVSWDLAALALTTRSDGLAAVRAAALDVEPDELALAVELRRLHLTAWYVLLNDRLPPQARRASELLASWR